MTSASGSSLDYDTLIIATGSSPFVIPVPGATLPGVPMIVIGHNARIAWGLTNTNPDVQDLYIERSDPDDPDRYLTPDGPRPYRTREEILHVG